MQIPKGYLSFSGWMLLIGGIMGFTGQLIHLEDVPGSVKVMQEFLKMAVNTHVLLAYASTFILLGLPGIFLRQSQALKWWGWLSFPLLFIGLMLEIFHGPVQILAYPIIFESVKTEAELQIVANLINNLAIDKYPLQLAVLIPIVPFLFIGLLLLGISTLKAKVLPKVAGIFVLFVLAILIISFAVPVHFHLLDISFAYVHLVFVVFGSIIAFEKLKKSAEMNNQAEVKIHS